MTTQPTRGDERAWDSGPGSRAPSRAGCSAHEGQSWPAGSVLLGGPLALRGVLVGFGGGAGRGGAWAPSTWRADVLESSAVLRARMGEAGTWALTR